MRIVRRKLRFVCGAVVRAPRVGVTASRTKEGAHRVTESMTNALALAGAELVMLDYPLDEVEIGRLMGTLDGVIFAGGPDVHPRYFGQPIDPYCGEIDEERDVLEMYLMKRVMQTGIPALGVCRGMQVMNIALGGSIYQDVVYSMGLVHRQPEGIRYFHDVIFSGDTALRAWAGSERYPVNSYHHQAVDRLADGLVPAAYAPDGLLEAFERPASRFFVGVQWHPEVSYSADAFSRRIFERFLEACRG